MDCKLLQLAWVFLAFIYLDFQVLLLQMTRLNEGLSLFDAILIVPMFQIAWTFFSICTGFVYFQEYQVLSLSLSPIFPLHVCTYGICSVIIWKFYILFLKQVLNALRTTMFILGMMSVFAGISLLASDDSKGTLIGFLQL